MKRILRKRGEFINFSLVHNAAAQFTTYYVDYTSTEAIETGSREFERQLLNLLSRHNRNNIIIVLCHDQRISYHDGTGRVRVVRRVAVRENHKPPCSNQGGNSLPNGAAHG